MTEFLGSEETKISKTYLSSIKHCKIQDFNVTTWLNRHFVLHHVSKPLNNNWVWWFRSLFFKLFRNSISTERNYNQQRCICKPLLPNLIQIFNLNCEFEVNFVYRICEQIYKPMIFPFPSVQYVRKIIHWSCVCRFT